MTATKGECMAYLRDMMVIRRLETQAGNAYRAKQIRGFCHLYSGQEAVCVGMKGAMTPDDDIVSAYRIHGWAYCMGRTVQQVLGELYGTAIGCSEGKGGSMHMYGDHFFGGNGIVGAQVPLGAGIAYASQYLGRNAVCYSLYGDGASNQGQCFEAYNIAKLNNYPAIFVCENNKFGMGTSAERSSANTDYYTRGDYVPGIWVDAMDVLAVRNACEHARAYALEHGPVVMEMETYRYSGHSMSDPDATYRTRDDIANARKLRDPIMKLKQRIVDQGWATEEELKALEKEVRKDVTAASDEALASGPPAERLLVDHILTGERMTGIRGCDITITYDQEA